ncbi:MAG: alpha/beta hydrolase [Ktedonobacteraceae bacterium]
MPHDTIVSMYAKNYTQRKNMPAQMGSMSLHGYRLHYRVIGVGSPLILIHGFGVSSHVWQRVVPYLAQEHQVFLVDLPGYGRSTYRETRASWRLREMAPLLAAWLQRMGLSSVHLMGHSMGGAIAIQLAAHAPEVVKSLLLVDAAGIPFRTTFLALAARSARSFVQLKNGSYPLPLIRDVLRPRIRLFWQGATQMVDSDFRAEIATLTMPALIIWGEHDVLVPISLGYELRDALPHAVFVPISNSGHRPMLAQPALMSGVVLAFLAEQE